MRRNIDEDAPTTEWAKPEPLQMETPFSGVELAALQSKNSAGWDTQTFAVRLPAEPEGPNRLVAMSIAAVLSLLIGVATFLLVSRLQTHAAADAQASMAIQPMSLAGAPLVEEGVAIPSPSYDPATAVSSMDIHFVPTGDVLAPPNPRRPELVPQAPASPIVPYTSTRSQHTAPAPTVRKGKKSH